MSRTMSKKRRPVPRARRCRPDSLLRGMDDLDHLRMAWRDLTPAERLSRSWAMRIRLRNPQAVHDAKLFPKEGD